MNVNGITPRVVIPGMPGETAATQAPARPDPSIRQPGDAAQTRAGQVAAGARSVSGTTPGTTPGTAQAVEGAAPAGVDPALWGVLNTDERAFYLRARQLGPLTYGPGRALKSANPAVRGGRLDVKV